LNELVVFWIIATSNMGQDGGLGLIINFSAAIIVSTFDDILVMTGRVQKVKEYFNELKEEVDEERAEEERIINEKRLQRLEGKEEIKLE